MNLGAIAAPFAAIYGAGVLLRRWAYDRGMLKASKAPVFAVSVGGLEAGGTGKTPIAGMLARALLRSGRKPGLLTRGYGRQSKGLVFRAAGTEASWQAIGDEPAMLVEGGLDVPVAACSRRPLGAARLAEDGCDCLVLDDAFAHRAMHRDLNIVVLRGERPLGNGHLLPWGSLREPISSLARADVLWLHFRAGVVGEVPDWLGQRFPRAPVVVSIAVPDRPRDLAGEPVQLEGARVISAAGIARPDDLADSAARLGAAVVARTGFRDHQHYGVAEVEELARQARRHGAEAVLVTPKDAVKLRSVWQGPPLWVLGVGVEIVEGGAALADRLEIAATALSAPD